MNNHEKEARIFKVLSVGTRLRMITLLKRHALCVNALARALEMTPAAVSQHLRVLRDAGIVTAEKRGYYVHYRLNDETFSELVNVIMRLLKTKKLRRRSSYAGGQMPAR